MMFSNTVYRDETLRKWEMDWLTVEDIQLAKTARVRQVIKTTQAADVIREVVTTMTGWP
jgi:hypothetical protein